MTEDQISGRPHVPNRFRYLRSFVIAAVVALVAIGLVGVYDRWNDKPSRHGYVVVAKTGGVTLWGKRVRDGDILDIQIETTGLSNECKLQAPYDYNGAPLCVGAKSDDTILFAIVPATARKSSVRLRDGSDRALDITPAPKDWPFAFASASIPGRWAPKSVVAGMH